MLHFEKSSDMAKNLAKIFFEAVREKNDLGIKKLTNCLNRILP